MNIISRISLALAMVCLSTTANAEGNASNPLAAVNNVDLRAQGTTGKAGDRYDYFIDGSQMLQPNVKLKYELHYNSNDFTGSMKSDFEKLVIKPIYFPYQTKLNDTWAMKTAVGFDLIFDLGDTSKAIGAGAFQFAPLAAIAFSHLPSGTVILPLVQHFTSFNGKTDINTTAARLIVIKPFGQGYWAKGDLKVPYDWEGNLWPVTAELQIGYNINSQWAVFADGLLGVGGDRPFHSGLGVGLRFKY